MKFKHMVEIEAEVSHLIAEMGVRYWEDATVNGVEEDNDDPKIPMRSVGNESWNIKIDLGTGKIEGWPEGVTAATHYKVCDAGFYSLIGHGGSVVASKDGYVPSMLCPKADGYGDYVILSIDADGVIDGWNADLTYFNDDEN